MLRAAWDTPLVLFSHKTTQEEGKHLIFRRNTAEEREGEKKSRGLFTPRTSCSNQGDHVTRKAQINFRTRHSSGVPVSDPTRKLSRCGAVSLLAASLKAVTAAGVSGAYPVVRKDKGQL
ncbi:hypothetical protein E2C01_078964 [Portunus trituberculatus]|uniref:Uncharacterized protein n=1 Tax=Portunus trituberculatus TaxID=210409 RepID=A0A5B7IP36_PORTR|nr:hypothetical protein [Portunus trituberculatus]